MVAVTWLRATIVDDRGKRAPLVEHETMLPIGPGAERAERLRSVGAGAWTPVSRDEWVRGVLLGLLALPVVLAVAVAPSYIAFRTDLPFWAKVLAGVPTGAVTPLVIVLIARRTAGRRLARWYVRAGYCASCAYDLTATPAEADGCRVCPECGSAWRANQDAAGPRSHAGPGAHASG